VLPDILPPETAEAFREIGIDTAEKAARVIALTASISRSPFPSPVMLKAYDDYRPGTGPEVMEWIKDQTRHRQSLERKRTDRSENRLDRAQRNSFVIGLFGLALAAGISYWSTLVGIVIAVVSVGGPASATVVARILDRLDKKN
jgi:uncharacterized membrane protein